MSPLTKVLAENSASITNFKANPNAIIEQSNGDAIAITKGSKACFYVVPPDLYEHMLEIMEAHASALLANEQRNDWEKPISVPHAGLNNG